MPIENLEYRKRKMLWSGNYEPTFTPEDRSLFIACAKSDMHDGREVSIRITNNNPDVTKIAVEPLGARDDFPLEKTFEIVMWVETSTDVASQPLTIVIEPQFVLESNFPLFVMVVKNGYIVLYTEGSKAVGIFELDGTGTSAYQQ